MPIFALAKLELLGHGEAHQNVRLVLVHSARAFGQPRIIARDDLDAADVADLKSAEPHVIADAQPGQVILKREAHAAELHLLHEAGDPLDGDDHGERQGEAHDDEQAGFHRIALLGHIYLAIRLSLEFQI